MVWGKDTPEKREKLELEVRRRLMATEKTKEKAKEKSGKDKGAKKK